MKKMIWLASWYPSRVDNYTGDFIERHARAAMLNNEIDLLHVVQDRNIQSALPISEKRSYSEGGQATIIYYKAPGLPGLWLKKISSIFLYIKIHLTFFKEYLSKNGRPDGIHIHTGLKAGLVALILKWRYRIPYFVTEHWSGFCPEAKPNFNDYPVIYKWLWKTVLKKSVSVSAVSQSLAVNLQKQFKLNEICIIPNVVDLNVFYPSAETVKQPLFLHISNLTYQKNPEQLLKAAAILKSKLTGFKLRIFGEADMSFKILSAKLKLDQIVEFMGLRPQEDLRVSMQQSQALILCSRYETFGCVVIEANACGIPVIVSDIPIFHEHVWAGINGLFTAPDNEESLALSIEDIANGNYVFDQENIRQRTIERFSFEQVSKQFNSLYLKYLP